MIEMLKTFLTEKGLSEPIVLLILRAGAVAAIVVVAFLADRIAKRLLLRGLSYFIKRTETQWDDVLLEKKVFNRLAHLAPAIVVHAMTPIVLPGLTDEGVGLIRRIVMAYVIVIAVTVISSILDALVEIYRSYEVSLQKPIKSYVQTAKVVFYLVGGVFVVSFLMDSSPWRFLGSIGALTAVLMLVFKDAILGFVAGIQLAANDMVRRGDWLEMPKYGADGDVIDISLTTVKVQNWDKTITTIPTYALISDSFKNWRGMSDSGGRRIKRAICIDMTSVKLCSDEMLKKFSKFQYIAEYIKRKNREVADYNVERGVDLSELVNGRRLTNVGTFRAYVEAYLRNHPKIHDGMTLMVRQLPPTDRGLPLEIYAFSNDQDWVRYEGIQADIIDHILAVASEFELRVFQNPSGADFQKLG